MKCDELKSYYYYEDRVFTPATHTYRVYHADKVDAAIAELKQKFHDVDNQWNEQCKEIAELKAKNRVLQSFYDLHGNVDNYIDQLKAKLESVQASAYADSVDAGMRERRLKRALYKACANWAHFAVTFFSSYATKEKWYKMEHKCINKAKEYR